MKKLTTEEFIKRAKNFHGDKYDYTKTHYSGDRNKLTIICPIHGEFEQYPSNHTKRSGCAKCNFEKDKYSQDNFIKRAKEKHKNSYLYDKTIYIDSYTHVVISCKEHGDFKQLPTSHLQGRGCPKCAIKNKSLSKEQFIIKSNKIHNSKYDYSKISYKNNHTKVIIICPIHGEFEQTPMCHLRGKGCPICKSSKGELTLENIFKKYNIKYKSQYNTPEIINNYKIDFYLPDYRILIEFHGKQHYEYIPYFHRNGEDDFLKQKIRDSMVRDVASRFKYNYLEFNYKQLKYMTQNQFEEMVIDKLNKHFLTNIRG